MNLARNDCGDSTGACSITQHPSTADVLLHEVEELCGDVGVDAADTLIVVDEQESRLSCVPGSKKSSGLGVSSVLELVASRRESATIDSSMAKSSGWDGGLSTAAPSKDHSNAASVAVLITTVPPPNDDGNATLEWWSTDLPVVVHAAAPPPSSASSASSSSPPNAAAAVVLTSDEVPSGSLNNNHDHDADGDFAGDDDFGMRLQQLRRVALVQRDDEMVSPMNAPRTEDVVIQRQVSALRKRSGTACSADSTPSTPSMRRVSFGSVQVTFIAAAQGAECRASTPKYPLKRPSEYSVESPPPTPLMLHGASPYDLPSSMVASASAHRGRDDDHREEDAFHERYHDLGRVCFAAGAIAFVAFAVSRVIRCW